MRSRVMESTGLNQQSSLSAFRLGGPGTCLASSFEFHKTMSSGD